jgi:regulator of replication initiation timing
MIYGNFTGKAKETPLNSNAIGNILLEIPDVNLEWLITGQGSMLKTDTYNNVSPPPATQPESNAQIERIYKELLKEKKAEYKADLKEFHQKIEVLNRDIGALINDNNTLTTKVAELQELLQAAKKSANRYAVDDRESFPSSMAAEPKMRYQKQE